MEPQELQAGAVGRVVVGAREVDLSTVPLGDLQVPSGRLGAADPFVNLDSPLVTSIPPGSYPVVVTLADISDGLDGSHLREAYLSVVVADGDVARVEVVVPDGEPPLDDPADHYGVPVDAGTVAFVDASAVATAMPGGDWYEDLFEPDAGGGWFSVMDDPTRLRAGSANIVMPRATAGENVVLTASGWGDGLYRVLKSYDADGRLLGVHIDLDLLPRLESVLARVAERAAAGAGAPAPAPAPEVTPATPAPTARRTGSWWRRLLGR